jgi:hypothetical protein
MYVCLHVYVCMHVYVCVCMCVYLCMCSCVYVCVSECLLGCGPCLASRESSLLKIVKWRLTGQVLDTTSNCTAGYLELHDLETSNSIWDYNFSELHLFGDRVLLCKPG